MAVTISRVGAAAADGATITIPAGHQAGDLILMYAFRSALTAPSLPTGWTNLGNSSSGASSYRIAGKFAASSAETSGAWLNATGLICVVYRNAVRDRFLDSGVLTGTGTTLTFGSGTLYSQPQTSWAVSFAATKTTTTLAAAPSGMTNIVSTIGAANAYAAHDTNGVNTDSGTYTARNVTVGVSAEWRTATVELLNDLSLPTNYQSVKVKDGMSSTERIR